MENNLEKTSQILRSGRKLSGFNQIEAAQALGVSQSLISKLESGTLSPDVSLWFAACKLYHLDPEDSYVSGYIDNLFSTDLFNLYPKSRFKIAEKYKQNAHIATRYALPFLQFLTDRLGDKHVRDFLYSKDIDPDFFYVLDAKLNMQFLFDLFLHLDKLRLLKTGHLKRMAKAWSTKTIHGALNHTYLQAKDTNDLISRFIANAHAYETAFTYSVDENNRKGIVLSITPNHHFDQVHEHNMYQNMYPNMYSDELKKAHCLYRQEHLREFATYGHGRGLASLQEKSCYFSGQKQCIYHLKIAA
jgi:transcriptional regulator with XRE-family HTH domain